MQKKWYLCIFTLHRIMNLINWYHTHPGWVKAVRIILSFVLSVILAAFITQFIPSLYIGHIQVETFILLGLFFGLLVYFNHKYKWMFHLTIILFVLTIVILIIGNIGWQSHMVVNNAKQSITLFNTQAEQVDIKPAQAAMAPHISLQKRIQQKVDYKDSVVRNFAVEHSLLYFDEYYTKYRQICRQFSLIKYIKDNYKYVCDPSGFDYFATPGESIQLMAGDCDDYSILMASTLKAIGVNVRIVWAPNHVYPEMYCGNQNNFDKYVNAIYTCFPEQVKNKQICYRLDKNNEFWLNLDFTDKYPGAPYASDEVLSIIYIK